MAETDILNPVSAWVDAIDDNPSPDYGFQRGRPDLRARAKAPGGMPDSREVQNAGHTLKLSWLNRSFMCVQAIMRMAAEHEDDYFTVIDHDGANGWGTQRNRGRHYVGRFEGDITPVQNANDSYDLRDLTFVEFPGAPMLQYPDDWEFDGIWMGVEVPRGSQPPKRLPATSGTWNRAVFAGDAGNVVTLTNPGNAAEWLCMEYRGYGFQLEMLTGPAYGQLQVFLDGSLVDFIDDAGNDLGSNVDLYSEDADAPTIVRTKADVPLDLHRVKLVVLGTRNDASTANAVTFTRLRVMR